MAAPLVPPTVVMAVIMMQLLSSRWCANNARHELHYQRDYHYYHTLYTAT